MKFEIGRVLVTNGINNRLENDEKFAKFISKSFARHCDGDWGDLCEEDKEMNESGLKNGDDRLFSRYDYGDEIIYIITEWDRSATTILFANEY